MRQNIPGMMQGRAHPFTSLGGNCHLRADATRSFRPWVVPAWPQSGDQTCYHVFSKGNGKAVGSANKGLCNPEKGQGAGVRNSVLCSAHIAATTEELLLHVLPVWSPA